MRPLSSAHLWRYGIESECEPFNASCFGRRLRKRNRLSVDRRARNDRSCPEYTSGVPAENQYDRVRDTVLATATTHLIGPSRMWGSSGDPA